nr:caspase recruitment domain-containing protein 19 isoform X2 [Ovis aries]
MTEQTYCDRLVQDTPFLTSLGRLSEQQVDRIILQLNRYYPQILSNKDAEKVPMNLRLLSHPFLSGLGEARGRTAWSSGTPRCLCECVSATSWATCSGAVSGIARSSTGPCTSTPSPCTAACLAGTPCVSACPPWPWHLLVQPFARDNPLVVSCVSLREWREYFRQHRYLSPRLPVPVSPCHCVCLSTSLCLPFSCAIYFLHESILCVWSCPFLYNLMNLGILTLLIRTSA